MKRTAKNILVACITLFLSTIIFTACGNGSETQISNGTTASNTNVHIHAFGEWMTVKEANCTENGNRERVCACGEKETQTIAMTGHTEVTDEAKSPTCTETGLTEGKHCSVCNEVLKAQEEVKAIGHTEVTDEAKSPTCAETGLTEGKHCSVCNEVLLAQNTVEKIPHSPEIGICNSCGNRHGWTKEEVQSIVKIYDISASSPNSAGGVGLEIAWENCSDKTIKYIYFNVSAYNAVDDILACSARRYYNVSAYVTGPIEAGKKFGNYDADSDFYWNSSYWDCLYYNYNIKQFKLNWVEIEYMDGTSVKISKEYLAHAMMERPKGLIYEYDASLGGYVVTGYVPVDSDNGNIIIPATYEGKPVVKIDDFALDDHLFKTVTLSENIRIICDYAFSDCKNLESIIIPNSVETIGKSAFYNCDNLKNVVIGAAEIGEDAFSWCDNLESVVISKNVSDIYYNAFKYSNNIKNVYYEGNETEWNKISGISNFKNATIHYNYTIENIK